MPTNSLLPGDNDRTKFTAEIVAAYVRNHVVPLADLLGLISAVQSSLSMVSSGGGIKKRTLEIAETQKPAVSIRKSIHEDHLTCLECGGNFKSMKRHLATFHHLSPAAYRTKWRLAAEYPMVAPAYAAARSILAQESGLGKNRRKKR
jgi:predicted transcriptional regulator